MKYVRTKDGKIYNTNELVKCEDKRFPNGWFTKNGFPLIGIKQSDTIEELCDEFIGVWINYYESKGKDAHEKYHYDKEKDVFYNDFEELTHKEAIEKFDIFYAAIWTDKGLIYVAKMNEKGDLELL